MRIIYQSSPLSKVSGDVLVLFLYENTKIEGGVKQFDAQIGGVISNAVRLKDFTGKMNSTMLLHPKTSASLKRVLLVGLGNRSKVNTDVLRQGISAAANAVKATPSLRATFSFSGIPIDDAEEFGQIAVETLRLSLYEFNQYRQAQNKRMNLRELVLLSDQNHQRKFRAGGERGEKISSAVVLARNLANEPANIATPTLLAKHAKDVARSHGLKCKVMEISDMKRLGMGALLGVAQGSEEPAKFIILEYLPPRSKSRRPKGPGLRPQVSEKIPTIVLAGKGITFDSGGISIKPSDKMDEMKFDMAGGAVVIAALQAVADLKLPVHVVGLVPSTENLPSGKAQRPGDIVRAMNGKTIEVLNTDAEGRMILADTLVYAKRYKPDAVIDLATLTGAIVIALGDQASGLFSNNAKLQRAIQAGAEASGERVWPMPMYEEYGEQIKGDIADLKNIGGRDGGPITAAKFLEQFTDYPWAHLDIAGTAWTTKPKPYTPKGATGAGVRLLIEVLKNWTR